MPRGTYREPATMPLSKRIPILASSLPPLSRQEEAALFTRLREIGEEPSHAEERQRIEDFIVRSNIRFALRQTSAFLRSNTSIDLATEAFSEALAGLLQGVRRFDHTRGQKFITYAVWWINQSLQRWASELGYTMRLPQSMLADKRLLKKAASSFFAVHERQPNVDELMEFTGLSFERIKNALSHNRFFSLDHPSKQHEHQDKGPIPMSEFHCDPGPLADEVLELEERKHALSQALGALPWRERYIVSSYYGLGQEAGSTLEIIGGNLGLTRERVRQLRNRAVDAMRRTASSYMREEARA